jgi:hypothetical protein
LKVLKKYFIFLFNIICDEHVTIILEIIGKRKIIGQRFEENKTIADKISKKEFSIFIVR